MSTRTFRTLFVVLNAKDMDMDQECAKAKLTATTVGKKNTETHAPRRHAAEIVTAHTPHQTRTAPFGFGKKKFRD